jgi:hypothetical protein
MAGFGNPFALLPGETSADRQSDDSDSEARREIMRREEQLYWNLSKFVLGALAVALFLAATARAQGSAGMEKGAQSVAYERQFSQSDDLNVIVKFKEGSNIRLREGQLVQVDLQSAIYAEAQGSREIRFES